MIAEQGIHNWQRYIQNRFPFQDKRIGEFILSWMSAREGAIIPFKSQIQPANFAPLLPYMWIMKYLPGADDFLIVLAGEKVNLAHHGNVAGRTRREIIGDRDYKTLQHPLRDAIESRKITYLTANSPLSRVEYHNGERVYAPVAANDDTADYLLGISLYTIMSSHQDFVVGTAEERYSIRCADLPG